ncbi:tyrosine recombinase XerC [Clostridium sp. WILCCON 0269]|uniref:Tyrosine recombinase XerC n=1 Tax=Candidatus Clostridium eludens TaxID=3381663 RepID=A0ABW8SP15_9CLOT
MAGSIEKRGENSYRLIVSGGRSGDGKRKKYTKTIKIDGKTEAEKKRKAEKELAKFIAEVENNSFIEPSKLTLKGFAEKWLKDYAEKNLAPKTLFRYKEIINSRIIPALGHLKLDKIKPLHLLEFYNNLQEDGIRKDGKPGGLSAETIKYHHRILHVIFGTAVKWQLLNNNPADKVDPPKVKKNEADFYNEDEVQQLIYELDKTSENEFKYKVAIILTLTSGMRLGELTGLKWGNIDFDKNTVYIVQSSQYLPDKGTFIKEPKNNTSIRTITLPEPAMNLLKKHKIHEDEKRLECGTLWNDTGFVFTQWNGNPMYPSTPSKWFKKFLEKHNLRVITFHQLRHTSASLLINENMNIRAISKRLGHSNASTTLNIYTHALKSADEIAAVKLENIIFKNEPNTENNKAK